MRVAFLTHNYPRTPGDVSGAFLRTLAVALVRRGVDVSVIAPSDRGAGGKETDEGVRVRRVRYASAAAETIAYRGTMASALRRPAGAMAFRALWAALRRAAGEELSAGADLIHAHWWVPGGLALPKGTPSVLTVHGTDAALLLCYVDHHDAAYRWAEQREIERHPTTGAAQFVEVRAAALPAAGANANQCVLELQDAATGTTLRLQLTGVTAAEVADVSRSLWSARS